MPSVRKQLKRVKSCENTSETESVRNQDEAEESTAAGPRSYRAQKSRSAAKMRRDLEGEELDRLAALLPYPRDVISKLDKASVLRLALCYFQIKHYTRKDGELLFEELKKANQNDGVNSGLRMDEGELMLDALGGFLIFVNRAGKIVYIHHQVANILGVQQVEVLGRNAVDFIHSEDKVEFEKNLQFDASTPPTVAVNDTCDTLVQERLFYVRMKCQAGNRHKHSGYILMQWSGRLHVRRSPGGVDEVSDNTSTPPIGLVAICRPLHSTPVVEIRMDGNMFITRHNMEMRFTFCDTRILNLLGYEPGELLGKTAYQFHNPHDADKIKSCHARLLQKGSGVSKFYRFMGKTGRWVWMKSRGTVIYSANNDPQYVVCINYVYTEEVGRRWQLLEEQRGEAQDPGVQGFIDVASLEAVSSNDVTTHPQGVSDVIGLNDVTSPSIGDATQHPVISDVTQGICDVINPGFTDAVAPARQNGTRSPSTTASSLSSPSSASPGAYTHDHPGDHPQESGECPMERVVGGGGGSGSPTVGVGVGEGDSPMGGVVGGNSSIDSPTVGVCVGEGDSPMVVSNSMEDNVYNGQHLLNSDSNSAIVFSGDNSSAPPFVAQFVNNEFNTNLCLDESTFELGEDTLQWLEENLLKSIQEQQQVPITATTTTTQGVTTQQQHYHSNGQQESIATSSTNSNHANATAPASISRTKSFPNPRGASTVPPPPPVRSHSYTSIATDHDYSAKPGERVRRGNRGHHNNASVDIEMHDDAPSNDAKTSQQQQKSHIYAYPQQNRNSSQPCKTQNIDSILVALLGNNNKNHHQVSGLSGGRYSSTKPSSLGAPRSSSSRSASSTASNHHSNQHRIHQHLHSNHTQSVPKISSCSSSAATATAGSGLSTNAFSAFPGVTDDATASHADAGTERFAVKFAENFVDQQGPEQLLPFLSDAMETPPDNPLTCLQDDTMVTSSSPPGGPFTGSNDCPFTENLYYGFSQLSSSPSFHSLATGGGFPDDLGVTSSSSLTSSSWRQSRDARRMHSPSSPTEDVAMATPKRGASLLEKFLLTKQPLNPNAGSDKVFKDTTEKISQLHLTDPLHRTRNQDGNLLKQLLTGEIDDKRMHQYEQRVINTRLTDTPSPARDLPMDTGFSSLDGNFNMDLFSGGAAGDMDSLLTNDVDMSMYGDVSDILREQIRQEDLWLQEYFTTDI